MEKNILIWNSLRWKINTFPCTYQPFFDISCSYQYATPPTISVIPRSKSRNRSGFPYPNMNMANNIGMLPHTFSVRDRSISIVCTLRSSCLSCCHKEQPCQHAPIVSFSWTNSPNSRSVIQRRWNSLTQITCLSVLVSLPTLCPRSLLSIRCSVPTVTVIVSNKSSPHNTVSIIDKPCFSMQFSVTTQASSVVRTMCKTVALPAQWQL